jgi:hypothetical protein
MIFCQERANRYALSSPRACISPTLWINGSATPTHRIAPRRLLISSQISAPVIVQPTVARMAKG